MCFFDHLQLRLWNSSRRLCLFILCGPHSNGDHLLGFSIELLTRGNNYRLLFSNSDDRKNNLLQGNEGGKKQGTGQSLAEEFPEDFQRDLEETYDGKSCWWGSAGMQLIDVMRQAVISCWWQFVLFRPTGVWMDGWMDAAEDCDANVFPLITPLETLMRRWVTNNKLLNLHHLQLNSKLCGRLVGCPRHRPTCMTKYNSNTRNFKSRVGL